MDKPGKPPLIKTWLNGFLAEHERTHPDAQWPDRASDSARRLWGTWFDAIKENRVTEDEARLASKLVPTAGVWCEEHPEALVRIVLDMRKRMTPEGVQARAGLPASDRASAQRTSRNCPRCRGEGLATVFHPKYTGSSIVTVEVEGDGGEIISRTVPGRVAAHCECPMGRWMRGETEAEDQKRVPDLVEVLAGRSRWLAEDPTLDEDDGGELPRAADGCVDWRAMVQGIGVNVGAKR